MSLILLATDTMYLWLSLYITCNYMYIYLGLYNIVLLY